MTHIYTRGIYNTHIYDANTRDTYNTHIHDAYTRGICNTHIYDAYTPRDHAERANQALKNTDQVYWPSAHPAQSEL